MRREEIVLEIKDLAVKVDDRLVLEGLNLSVRRGEVHVIFGQNGSGKSTLLGAIMGLSRYRVTEGDILFLGSSVLGLSIHERARLGIGLAFQSPRAVRGVSLRSFLKLVAKDSEAFEGVMELASEFNFHQHLDRDLNVGFSGGEMKKSEVLQLIAQDPTLLMLDEPESGVDFENIALLGEALRRFLEREKPFHQRTKSAILITHSGHILDYVTADVGHVMVKGRFACSGNPYDIFRRIREKGYAECVECYLCL